MRTDINSKMEDIILDISIRSLSRRYFEKSVEWFHSKLYGEDKDNNPVSFTDKEISKLKEALCDLSDRIRKVAESL